MYYVRRCVFMRERPNKEHISSSSQVSNDIYPSEIQDPNKQKLGEFKGAFVSTLKKIDFELKESRDFFFRDF